MPFFVSLNKPVKQLIIYAGENAEALKLGSKDIMDTLKVENLEIIGDTGGEASIEAYDGIGYVMEILES